MIGTFVIPETRLIYPEIPLSFRETKVLFEGTDLANFLIEWNPNPFIGVDPRTLR